ncbi:MAG: amino acid adenylation domain-containing protein [Planctomycetota bacterium]|nr:amino acid adenylation domain-containing protein [Planctomycetota bacterium]
MSDDVESLLADLRRKEIRLWIEGDRLRVNAPKGAITPELQAALTQAKPRIIEFLRRAATERAGPPPLVRVPREARLPVSFGQERLWFLQQWEAGSAIFNLSSVIELRGPLDVAVLSRALGEIVKRHEALRTTLATVDGQPTQVIAPATPPEQFTLPVVDLRALPSAERDARVEELTLADATRSFDLAAGPLLVLQLLRVGPERDLLQLTVHHSVADDWSGTLLFRELSELYEAFAAGRPSPLEELPLQYADFAAWQRRWVGGEVLRDLVDYWKKRLTGVAALDLPTDRPRPPEQTFDGSNETVMLDPDLTARLNAFARAQGVTPFMALLAGLQVLLHRYSGQEDFAVGTPVATRARVELERMIGFFINNLVLRADLAGEPTVRELLARVKRTALDAFAHQELPFEKLVEELKLRRDPSRSPLFQVLFNFDNNPQRAGAVWPRVVGQRRVDPGVANYDLSLYAAEMPEGMRLKWEYNTDLFDVETVRRIAGHYRAILEAMIADPDRRVADLSLLTPAEVRTTLDVWNRTEAALPAEETIHDLVAAQMAAQIRRSPDAVAAIAGEEQATFAQLDRRANQLAHHLRARGVGPDVLVGLCVERSIDLLVGMLGILRAGGAYLPLDPAFPPKRLAYMLRDAKAPLVVAHEALLPVLGEHDAKVLCLDRDRAAIAAEPASPLPPIAKGNNLAYVIYTSGSTGNPKGVELEHRSVVSFLQSMAKTPGLGPDDVLLAITTLSFDIAGLELWLPLVVGARVVVAKREQAGDPQWLLETIRSRGVTVMQATPATWRMLVASGWDEKLPLKALCGGEPLPRDLAGQLLERCDTLWNMYGPTETTIWSTLSQVTSAEGLISIGRPIDNTTVFIADAQLRLLPAGVPGELLIGGAGLARGYRDRAELTAQKFVVPSWNAGLPGSASATSSSANPAKAYRTGDLARFRHDGTLEMLGRIDHQVKLRGFRIELGEVEAALAAHPSVRQAVAVVHQVEAGDARLVAYLVGPDAASDQAAADARPAPADLRLFLQETLPSYMMPSTFVWMAAFPLTANGKVDRRALPPPNQAPQPPEAAASASFEAPATPTEKMLAEIFREVLQVERVGRLDNFFDLGGHSLLSMKVVDRFEKARGVKMHPGELVAQNVAQIASHHDAAGAKPDAGGAGKPKAGLAGRLGRAIKAVIPGTPAR